MRASEYTVGNIEYHSNLNPVAWHGDQLRIEIRYRLLKIANTFVNYLEIPNFKILDIVLTGSLANYNWTKYSDFDIHVVTDYADLECDDLVDAFYQAKKKIWNDAHDITIKSHEAELYVEDVDQPPVSGGIYSILENKWLSKPEFKPPTINDRAVNIKVASLIHDIKQTISNATDAEDIKRLKDKIQKMRRVGLDQYGEFSVENLSYKVLRNLGYIDKLVKSYHQTQDTELSLKEGGWDTTLTQNTVLNPRIVAPALKVVDQFVKDFNAWLSQKRLGPVRRGRPTGSSAYHEVDTEQDPDKIYGDIDLQMIAPEPEGVSYGQFTGYWNKLADDFVKAGHTSYIDTSESKAGHPIFQIGAHDYVQIDFMWHPERLEQWGAARVTPERGVKGLLTGNMFSVLGELLDLSIQHAGVQLKVQDGQHVPFSKQKDTQVVTVTTDPETFIYDIFKYEAKQLDIDDPTVNSMLRKFPGNDIADVKISKLVNGIKGFAFSCEENNMFGKGDLANFTDSADFISKFWQRYEAKAIIDVQGKKRDKAQTPAAIARATSDREKILQGLETVKGYFQ